MKISKDQIKQIVLQEARKELKENWDEEYWDDDFEVPDFDDEPEYSGGAHVRQDYTGGLSAVSPRTGETRDLGGEILRLAHKAGKDPFDLLTGFGFSPQMASNLLGMTDETIEYARLGITFDKG
tara:strand:+ start:234 stop:605 length:372 start_codon:yes stop_codon:yes gene_type:complete